jgi:hypothetical protein
MPQSERTAAKGRFLFSTLGRAADLVAETIGRFGPDFCPSSVMAMHSTVACLGCVYFGLPNSEGNIDERFHDLVFALEDLTDSVVFFSTYIAKKMGEQSTKLAKEIGKKAPKAVVWRFDSMDPEHEELIPKGEAFPDWK